MAPKGKSRKKKAKRTKKSEPDGKNSLTVNSEATLGLEKLTSTYTNSIINVVVWDTLGGVPCFTCTNVKRCGLRQPVRPVTCQVINAWLEYESLPPAQRLLVPPDFRAIAESQGNLKLEGATSIRK